MTVRIVLDTSALIAYADLESMAVGELITMVDEDSGDAVVGIPAVSLLEAYARVKGDGRVFLTSLTTRVNVTVAVLPLLGADALEVADLADQLPSAGLAHAVRETRQHDALLATYEGDHARVVLTEDQVLDL